MERFYTAAATGTLPALSWMLPPLQACDHPCYDVAKGERLLKDIYEALRASPQWEKTLFFVTYVTFLVCCYDSLFRYILAQLLSPCHYIPFNFTGPAMRISTWLCSHL
jgi:hypothetical protein